MTDTGTEHAPLVAEVVACRHLLDDYVKRLDAACEEYYGTGKSLFPNLSRAEDEDLDARCELVLKNAASIDPDALTRWNGIRYPIDQYHEQIERMRDLWTRRKNLFRALEVSLNSRLGIQKAEGESGPTVTHYNITIKDVVGPVNVLSSLDGVVQTVKNSPSLSSDSKEKLASLLEELKASLADAPATHAEDAAVVSEQAQAIADELSRSSPRAPALKVKASGLVEAAKAMATVVPTAIDIARKIATFVVNPIA